jgi:sulfatase maturation enzyme AslB (radical SAM superfamily)
MQYPLERQLHVAFAVRLIAREKVRGRTPSRLLAVLQAYMQQTAATGADGHAPSCNFLPICKRISIRAAYVWQGDCEMWKRTCARTRAAVKASPPRCDWYGAHQAS